MTTIFRTGSVGKVLTWTAIMQLVEQGKLDLDADINTYLDFQIPDTSPQPITLRHLMTHTSGMGEATSEESAAAKTLADLMPAFASKPLSFAPGSQWKYCQSGINTLCRIVEVVSGLAFGEFLQQPY